jgi:hypothetical protein
MADRYLTDEEWISDPNPYGSFVWCEKCGSRVEIEHEDVFHHGKCQDCGTVVGSITGDDACAYHSEIRGKCQAFRDDPK